MVRFLRLSTADASLFSWSPHRNRVYKLHGNQKFMASFFSFIGSAIIFPPRGWLFARLSLTVPLFPVHILACCKVENVNNGRTLIERAHAYTRVRARDGHMCVCVCMRHGKISFHFALKDSRHSRVLFENPVFCANGSARTVAFMNAHINYHLVCRGKNADLVGLERLSISRPGWFC